MATYFIQNTNSVEDIEQMNNVIDKVNKVNTEATSNIGQLTDLNNKAQELSNNIQQALPINTELKENIKIGQPLVQEATTKNAELQASLEKTKKFIEGLDGSQNIPQIRMDVNELQNGLKSNQALAYTGSSISANNTLEGRTEGMRICGRTLVNLCEKSIKIKVSSNTVAYSLDSLFNLRGKELTIITDKKVNAQYAIYYKPPGGVDTSIVNYQNNNVIKFTVPNLNYGKLYVWIRGYDNIFNDTYKFIILEGDWTNKPTPQYFEGLKSFGESEQEGDKYKISILSHGKNLFDINKVKLVLFNSNGYIATENYNNTPSINLEPNTNYSIKFPEDAPDNKGFLFDRNGFKTREISQNTSQGYIFTTTNDEVGFSFYRGGGQITFKPSDINNYKIMLIEGTKTIDYEPYQFDKKDILLKEPLKEDDYLYEDNGQVKVYRDARKYVITGNEDWAQYTDNRDFACMGFFLQLNKDFDAKLGGKFICNNFKGSDTDVFPGNITVDDEIIFVKGRSGEASPSYIKISILKSKLTTQNVEGFKEWLKANPTEIVYQLATPTVEIVENCVDIDLDTYQDKTYFSINNTIPGSLDFKVPSNIASIVQSTAREVNNIWDVINNLLVPSLIDINKNVAMSTIKNNLK